MATAPAALKSAHSALALRPPAVRLIGKSNGVGLARDLTLLADALRRCGCEVQVYATQRADARQRRSIFVQFLAWVSAWVRRRRRDRGIRVTAAGGTAVEIDEITGTPAPPPSPIGLARAGSVAGASPNGLPRQINLMLEHVWPQFLHTANLNIAVPNPEWFDRRDRRLLMTLDGVWAKTRHTQRIFEALGCRTAYIGFDSEDRYEPSVPRERSFFHLAGKSHMKGTDRLLRLWRRHPEWPSLVLVYHDERGLSVPDASNVQWYRDYLPDPELRRLQNASRFHLCLSEAEGWGHYIVEALSIGAVTVTLDAAPMNELVQPERGLLVGYSGRGRQNLTDTFSFDEAALERIIAHALQLDESTTLRLGHAARQWFLENRRAFPHRIADALAGVDALGGGL